MSTEELTREERVLLASSYFGLYTLPLSLADAKSQSELTDIDCCMDNMCVPFYRDQLNEKMVKILEEEKERKNASN